MNKLKELYYKIKYKNLRKIKVCKYCIINDKNKPEYLDKYNIYDKWFFREVMYNTTKQKVNVVDYIERWVITNDESKEWYSNEEICKFNKRYNKYYKYSKEYLENYE